MKRLDQRGVAPIAVLFIFVVSAGGTVGVPVAVDVADVDPDSPLYALERFGERVRMVGDEDQMMERWEEYAKLVDHEKGLEYKRILEEFKEKLTKVAPGDNPPSEKVAEWMQKHAPEMTQVQLKLSKEMLEKCKEGLPELVKELEDEIGAIEDYEKATTLPPELREEIQSRLELIEEKVEGAIEENLPNLMPYVHIHDVLGDVNINVNIEINLSTEVLPDLKAAFEEKLDEFNEELAEIEAKLEGADVELEIGPGEFGKLRGSHGLNALEQLVEVAKAHKEKAIAAFEAGKYRKALCLIRAGKMKLRHSEEILEHATEWEEEYRELWEEHFKRFEKITEKMEEEFKKGWEEIVEQYEENLEEWKEKITEGLEEWKEEEEELRAWIEQKREEMERVEASLAEKVDEAYEKYGRALESFAAELPVATEEELKAIIGAKQPYLGEFVGLIEYPVSWEITDGNFSATIDVSKSFSIGEIGECEFSVSGTITGEVSENELSADLEANTTVRAEAAARGVSISFGSDGTLTGSVSGTFTDGFLDADVEGQGSADVSGEVSSDFGSCTYACTVTYAFEGKLLGEVTGNEFEGTMYLWITARVEIANLSFEISTAGPGL